MKKWMVLLATALLCLLLAASGCAEEQADKISEWTVMFYFCGSDLESGHGYATGNLEEISYCLTYDTIMSIQQDMPDTEPAVEDVNVVIETGGSKEWHAQKLGMDVKTDMLQRWHFRPARNVAKRTLEILKTTDKLNSKTLIESFADAIHTSAKIELEQELPLASMADSGTLADFIRWSAEKYPAKKYALVLWDHGTGAAKGLLIDELFDGDTMGLDELKAALKDSGVHFEAVMFDACLMANLETACAIKDSADWMIASEELVAGKGSAMYSWLQQLYCTPQWNGMRLGRWVCEMTQEKYTEEKTEQAGDTLTWSVIDLKKIDRLAAAFDRFFEVGYNTFVNNPDYMFSICESMNNAFEFGLGDAAMIDLSRIPAHAFTVIGLERSAYVEFLDALMEAVVFNAHGPNRASAGGISFCYATRFSSSQLDAYAKVCPSNYYLALLDAINPNWNAPDSVYEKVKKLPEITEIPNYQIRVEKSFFTDGTPGFHVVGGFACLREAHAIVYRRNPRTGETVCMGKTVADGQIDLASNRVTYILTQFDNWPTVEDVYCSAELISQDYLGRALYNIPIRMDNETFLLRCGVEEFDKKPIIYGLWQGYDADSGVFSRDVISLSGLAGREYSLLYPIDDPESTRTRYEASEPMTMLRSLEISSKPLDAGTYYLEYWVEDIFQRHLPVGRAEVYWDGKNVTVPDKAAWEGTLTLTLKDP